MDDAIANYGSAKDMAEKLRKSARSENTRKAYAKAWDRFSRYCLKKEIDPQKASAADVVGFFIQLASQRAGNSNQMLSMGTLKLYRSALNRCFTEMDLASPASAVMVGDVLGGLSRIRNDLPRRVKALREYEITAMLKRCPDSIFGSRDAAMISLGFAAALRRSELCNLLFEDINFISTDKMVVLVRQSKTDQRGKGQKIAVLEGKAVKPVSHLKAWLEKTDICKGYLFQTFSRGCVLSGKSLNYSEVA